MVQANPWIDFKWPIVKGKPLDHKSHTDLRKYVWLCTEGHYSHKEGAQFAAKDTASKLNAYAGSFEDFLSPYAQAANIDWQDVCADWTDATQKPKIGMHPGSVTVFHEHKFTVTIAKVNDASEFVICGTLVTCNGIYGSNGRVCIPTSEQWYREYDELRPGTPILVSGFTGNDIPNNGFVRVKSRRMGNPGNGESASDIYIRVDNQKYEQKELVETTSGGTAECDFGGDWYTWRACNGHADDAGGGTNTYFGGLDDAVYAGGSNDKWWTLKDTYHRYDSATGVQYGPNDGRPPSGGIFSCDFNGDWVRTKNPNLYHTYDRNAHRWFIRADVKSGIEYITVFPCSEFLCAQVDPKEIIPPYRFKNTHRTHWKYGGKVKIKASQITNPDKLGPVSGCMETGYTVGTAPGVSYAPASSDRQYHSIHTEPAGSGGERTVAGDLPIAGLLGMEKWGDRKYDEAIQNMVEFACEKYDWALPADSTYISNWLWLHQDEEINIAMYTLMYPDHDFENDDPIRYGSNTAHWRPDINDAQPMFPLLSDECWGENGSAFELILKKLGTSYYDWYYDDITPHRSTRLMNQAWRWKATQNPIWWAETFTGATINGVYVPPGPNALNAMHDATYKIPVATIRRTWKKSLGRVSNCKMIAVEKGEPSNQTYEFINYDGTTVRMVGRCIMAGHEKGISDFAEWTQSITPNGYHFTVSGDQTSRYKTGYMICSCLLGVYESYCIKDVVYNGTNTIVTMDEHFNTVQPTSIYGDSRLSERHDADYMIRDTKLFGGNVLSIMNMCLDVLGQLKYKAVTLDISVCSKTSIMGPTEFDTCEKLYDFYHAKCVTEFNIPMHEWGVSGASAGSNFDVSGYRSGTQYGYNPANDRWRDYGPSTSSIGAVRITELPGAFGKGRTVNVFMQATAWPYSFYEGQRTQPGTIGVRGCVNITVLDDNIPFYGFAGCSADSPSETYYDPTTKKRYYYFGFVPIEGYTCPYEKSDFTWNSNYNQWNNAYGHGRCGCQVGLAADNQVLYEFDWNGFDDEIWYRLFERADYKLIDLFGEDTRPPQSYNEWVQTPTLYDSNWQAEMLKGGQVGSLLYDNPNYVPRWKLKAVSVLMEDIEGNGVEYILDSEHATKTEADMLDKVQSSRTFDILLNMGDGDHAGDDADAWVAYDALINEWLFTLNSKDCYSSNVPGKNDNYGTPTSAVTALIDAPMFPLTPRSKAVEANLFLDGDRTYESFSRIIIAGPTTTEYWDWMKFDIPLTPTEASCQFVIERRVKPLPGVTPEAWTALNLTNQPLLWDFTVQPPVKNVTVGERAANMVSTGCFWFQVTVPEQRYEYRVRYQNSSTHKTGIPVIGETPADCILKIRPGNSVRINSQPVSLPYVGYFPSGTDLTLLANPFWYYWLYYERGGGSVSQNPWVLTLDYDRDVMGY